MRFDLYVDIDQPKVRDQTLKSLWNACYSPEGVSAGNDFGQLVQSLRGAFPKLSREEFDRQFGEAVDRFCRELPSLVSELNARFQKEMKGAKVLCLSERCDSILMWSH